MGKSSKFISHDNFVELKNGIVKSIVIDHLSLQPTPILYGYTHKYKENGIIKHERRTVQGKRPNDIILLITYNENKEAKIAIINPQQKINNSELYTKLKKMHAWLYDWVIDKDVHCIPLSVIPEEDYKQMRNKRRQYRKFFIKYGLYNTYITEEDLIEFTKITHHVNLEPKAWDLDVPISQHKVEDWNEVIGSDSDLYGKQKEIWFGSNGDGKPGVKLNYNLFVINNNWEISTIIPSSQNMINNTNMNKPGIFDYENYKYLIRIRFYFKSYLGSKYKNAIDVYEVSSHMSDKNFSLKLNKERRDIFEWTLPK